MTHRIFRDERGVAWQAWDVFPTSSVAVRSDLVGGWIAFECTVVDPAPGAEQGRRRIAPIPPAWSELPEAALQALLASAEPASRRPRLP